MGHENLVGDLNIARTCMSAKAFDSYLLRHHVAPRVRVPFLLIIPLETREGI